MRNRLRKVLASVLALLVLAPSMAMADTITSNDTNQDGYVDRLHIKPDGIQLYNDTYSYGYRVAGLTVASIDPHWNQKTYGIESVRVIPDRASAKLAMQAQNYPGIPSDWNPVYPDTLFSAFFLLDNNTSASIFQVTPTSAGTTSIPWAKALIQLISIGIGGNPYVNTLATYILDNYIDGAGGSGIQSINGGTNNYAYNTSRFFDYNSYMQSPTSSLPPSVATRDAHLGAYASVGVAHEYQYRETTWSHGSQHPVQSATRVTYCYWNGYTYCWAAPTVYKGYYAQGY